MCNDDSELVAQVAKEVDLNMDLLQYEQKYVLVKDKYGNSFSGLARYGNRDFLECEFGGDEDGIFIENCLIYNSQVESIEEIVPHGTAELWTEHLVLRKYRPEDAEPLCEYLGKDPEMYKYSGWNPYATFEMAKETVQRFIESYGDEHSYSWIMDANGDDVVAGTIGAYDYESGLESDFGIDCKQHCEADRIEVGFSVVPGWQGRGYATEALKKVLEYLTENEGISCVTAWCAADNTASKKVLEKSGMSLVRVEEQGLTVGDKTYDKLIYEYRKA